MEMLPRKILWNLRKKESMPEMIPWVEDKDN
jgi:hypothetical protein